MKKLLYFPKNLILTLVGVVSLFVNVYIGAFFFLSAVLAEKLLKAFGSKTSVDELINEFELTFRTRYDTYRESWDNFSFKGLKLPF